MTDETLSPNLAQRVLAALGGAGRASLRLARGVAKRLGPALAAFWRVAKPILRGALQMLLALIIVFEEWGWQPLADLLGRFAKWRPWAMLETGIARLPPYLALVVFVLPTLILLPLKFLAVLLVARGQIILAGLLFLAAKVVATALIARLFLLTQPALMQIAWFARGYDIVMPWKDALVERVHTSYVWRVSRLWKERARRVVRRQWWQMRPTFRRLRTRLVIAARAGRRFAGQVGRATKQHIAAYLAR